MPIVSYIFDIPLKISESSVEKAPQNWIASDNAPHGKHHMETVAAIMLISNIHTLIDVGANAGTFAMFKAVIPKLNVHAFEPNMDMVRVLEDNIRIHGVDIHVHPFGLSNTTGCATLAIDPTHSGLSVISSAPTRFPIARAHMQPIEVRTLDSMSFDFEPYTSMLKIDTEGHELFVLRGGTEFLKTSRPYIFMEWNTVNMHQCRVSEAEVTAFMKEHNYVLSQEFPPEDRLYRHVDAPVITTTIEDIIRVARRELREPRTDM